MISMVHSKECAILKDTDYGLNRFMICNVQKDKVHFIFDCICL